jgi:hypothetical protein
MSFIDIEAEGPPGDDESIPESNASLDLGVRDDCEPICLDDYRILDSLGIQDGEVRVAREVENPEDFRVFDQIDDRLPVGAVVPATPEPEVVEDMIPELEHRKRMVPLRRTG